ncbi:DUF4262 domain-containing protein [Mycobacterium talmoniae]|uniref:DUF4262 domain-containing protein n=1 Tax=Mycobacterium talmoniae TaxID=1858794 RepID=A0A1S1NN76_9MYCO|nr:MULTISPECIES: DUF4262 domain-containing protein [Mycobacterium]OHV05725.1 hypothetical protein BKN37_04585 [Mycobacterium talmoniae]PQM47061.1 hypothetical protein C1Y40_02772 [Mycobacterium talmoniae]TDH56597.1 DUF4262 domain-containing protein [Mycobacterium eburneum]
MCWKCDHPDSTVEEWLDAIRETVDKRGWAVQYVEDERTPYAYTVGLHEHGLPELLVTGLAPQPTALLLNNLAAYLMEGGKPIPGELIATPDGPPLEVVQVEHPDAHMNVAVAFYGPDLRALQLVWADERGHQPWCPEFSGGRVRQPVLGLRAERPPLPSRDGRHRRR